MDEQQTAFFEDFYWRARNRRGRDGWAIELNEWLTFWGSHPLRDYKIEKPRGVSMLRQDETADWTIANLVVVTKSDVLQRRPRVVPPVDTTVRRTMSVSEWLSEVRG